MRRFAQKFGVIFLYFRRFIVLIKQKKTNNFLTKTAQNP